MEGPARSTNSVGLFQKKGLGQPPHGEGLAKAKEAPWDYGAQSFDRRLATGIKANSHILFILVNEGVTQLGRLIADSQLEIVLARHL